MRHPTAFWTVSLTVNLSVELTFHELELFELLQYFFLSIGPGGIRQAPHVCMCGECIVAHTNQRLMINLGSLCELPVTMILSKSRYAQGGPRSVSD